MKKIALLAILCVTVLDISAAGVKFINQTGDNICATATAFGSFVGDRVRTVYLRPNEESEKLDFGLGGVESVKWISCGGIYRVDLHLQGIEGIRNYNIKGSSVDISDVGWDPAIGPKKAIPEWQSTESCCSACKP